MLSFNPLVSGSEVWINYILFIVDRDLISGRSKLRTNLVTVPRLQVSSGREVFGDFSPILFPTSNLPGNWANNGG